MGNIATDVKVLTIEEMLSADDISYTTVQAWGGMVRLGSLDAGTMLEFVQENQGPAKHTAGIRMFIRSLVNEKGERIGNLNMMEAFKKKNARVLNRLVDEIMKLNGFGTSTSIDIGSQLNSAGTDPEKLKTIVTELRQLAQDVEDAGTDEEKLAAVMSKAKEREQADAKNA